jgi:hypothetical protein
MPRFDGTGPLGQGAMTGGGRGFCAGYTVPKQMVGEEVLVEVWGVVLAGVGMSMTDMLLLQI